MSGIESKFCDVFCPLDGNDDVVDTHADYCATQPVVEICPGSRIADRGDDEAKGYYEVRTCPKWLLEGFAVLSDQNDKYLVSDMESDN